MTKKKISKLAISSVILSISSIFLGLSWIPGVICGHMARARIKSNPDLRGQPLALAGLITGYFFPVALLAIVLYLSGYLEGQIAVVVPFIKKMIANDTFLAQVTRSSNPNPYMATFDIKGLGNAITPLTETCPWE